jgi:hypothetical protein
MSFPRNSCTILLFVVFALVLLLGAYHQTIDGDEGAYLVVIRSIMHGAVPGVDVGVTQAPLFFWMSAVPLRLLGELTLMKARLLSIMYTFGTGVLLYWYVRRIFDSRKLASVALVLLAANIIFFTKNVHFVHYAVTNFWMLASFVLLVFAERDVSRLRNIIFFGAGVAVGIAANLRAPFVLLILINLSWIIWRNRRLSLWPVAAFLVGVLLASLPSIYLLLTHGDILIFDSIGWYKYARPAFGVSLFERLKFFASLHVFINPTRRAYQLALLLMLAFAAMVLLVVKRYKKEEKTAAAMLVEQSAILALGYLICIFMVYVIISTVFMLDYWNTAIPFEIIAGVYFLSQLAGQRCNLGCRLVGGTLLADYIFIFCFVGTTDDQWPRWGVYQGPVAYVRYDHRHYKSYRSIAATESAATIVKNLTTQNDTVLCWFNALLIYAHRNAVPGFEELGIFCKIFLPYLPDQEAVKYKFFNNKMLMDVINARRAKVIVTDPYTAPDILALLPSDKYLFYTNICEYRIYVNQSR